MAKNRHVYHNSVVEHVIASSLAEAKRLYKKYCKEIAHFDDSEIDLDMVQSPDSSNLTITFEDFPKTERIKASCGWWANHMPKGFLCSTEY